MEDIPTLATWNLDLTDYSSLRAESKDIDITPPCYFAFDEKKRHGISWTITLSEELIEGLRGRGAVQLKPRLVWDDPRRGYPSAASDRALMLREINGFAVPEKDQPARFSVSSKSPSCAGKIHIWHPVKQDDTKGGRRYTTYRLQLQGFLPGAVAPVFHTTLSRAFIWQVKPHPSTKYATVPPDHPIHLPRSATYDYTPPSAARVSGGTGPGGSPAFSNSGKGAAAGGSSIGVGVSGVKRSRPISHCDPSGVSDEEPDTDGGLLAAGDNDTDAGTGTGARATGGGGGSGSHDRSRDSIDASASAAAAVLTDFATKPRNATIDSPAFKRQRRGVAATGGSGGSGGVYALEEGVPPESGFVASGGGGGAVYEAQPSYAGGGAHPRGTTTNTTTSGGGGSSDVFSRGGGGGGGDDLRSRVPLSGSYGMLHEYGQGSHLSGRGATAYNGFNGFNMGGIPLHYSGTMLRMASPAAMPIPTGVSLGEASGLYNSPPMAPVPVDIQHVIAACREAGRGGLSLTNMAAVVSLYTLKYLVEQGSMPLNVAELLAVGEANNLSRTGFAHTLGALLPYHSTATTIPGTTNGGGGGGGNGINANDFSMYTVMRTESDEPFLHASKQAGVGVKFPVPPPLDAGTGHGSTTGAGGGGGGTANLNPDTGGGGGGGGVGSHLPSPLPPCGDGAGGGGGVVRTSSTGTVIDGGTFLCGMGGEISSKAEFWQQGRTTSTEGFSVRSPPLSGSAALSAAIALGAGTATSSTSALATGAGTSNSTGTSSHGVGRSSGGVGPGPFRQHTDLYGFAHMPQPVETASGVGRVHSLLPLPDSQALADSQVLPHSQVGGASQSPPFLGASLESTLGGPDVLTWDQAFTKKR